MSRSYRKVPCVTAGKVKGMKRVANKRVRHYKGKLSNGREYQKLFNSWDICDYIWFETKEEVIKNWESAQKDKANGVRSWHTYYQDQTLEECLKDWKMSYKCK